MKKTFFLLVFLTFSVLAFSQDYIKHTVEKGDTLYSLAKKYGVTVSKIINLNPEAKDGIKLGTTIIIPKENKAPKTENKKSITHKVLPKETFFGIAQRYGTTIQAIQQENKDLLVDGLHPGQELIITIDKKTESSTTIIQNDAIVHIVHPKETKYAITKKYNISEDELIAQNPHVKEMLREGDTVRISLIEKSNDLYLEEKIEETESLETADKKEFKNLTIKDYSTKNVAIILPFRAYQINNVRESFKKDKLLSITVDYYSGCLLAIEEIEKMGGNFNIFFYDSEGNSSVSIEKLVRENNFSDMDAIIGPFYQSNVEKVASMLESDDVLVVSPLSTEGKANYKNLYLATPPTGISKKMMLEYINAKNQNTIAIIDRKKTNIKEFIANNYSEIKFASEQTNKENLKPLLDKDQMNYVILETESTSLILNIINLLSELKKYYPITLVTLDRNDAFESDEIKSQDLANLNLHYPSSINESINQKNSYFYRKYKEKNNVFPSVAAVKGYDITLDVLLRLSQNQDFYKIAKKIATKQNENKFIYTKSEHGGYYNTGVYILYYDEDLNIKEAY